MPKTLLLYAPPPGTDVPPVATEPHPKTLPRYVENTRAIAIVTQYFVPVTSLDGWPELVWWQFGRKKFCRTALLLEVAKAKLDAVVQPPAPDHPYPASEPQPGLPPARPRPGEPAPRAAGKRRAPTLPSAA